MGAGTTAVTKTLDQCRQSLSAISGITVYQGKKRFSESDNLEETVRASTPEATGWISIWLEEYVGNNQTNMTQLTVGGLLVSFLPKDTTTDVNTLYDLVMACVTSLQREANFSMARPSGVTVQRSIDELEDGVVEYDFRARFILGPTCS
jgi:hypothetical protein